MRRLLLWTGVLALAFPAGAWAQGPPGSGGSPGSGRGKGGGAAGGRDRHAVTPSQRVLGKKVELVDWVDVPLEEVADWVKEQGPVNVVVRWRALEAEGIDAASPVTLRLGNTTVGKVLAEVLDQISETESVMFRGMGNTIKISTRSDFNRKLYVRVYDVSDILLRIPDFNDAPEIDLTEGSGGGGGGRGGGGGGGGDSIFGDDDDDDDDEQDEEDFAQRIADLIDLIEQTVEPDTWLINGGRGTIVAFGKLLVVRNSIEVHEKIGGPFVFK